MSALTSPLKRSRWVPAARDGGHLHVVEAPVRRHTLAYALTVLLVLAGAVFGAVALNAMAASAAVRSRELDVHVAAGEQTYAQLVADVASLEDPERIRSAALELGLVPAGPSRHVVLERSLPADGAVSDVESSDGDADPLKSLLSAGR